MVETKKQEHEEQEEVFASDGQGHSVLLEDLGVVRPHPPHE